MNIHNSNLAHSNEKFRITSFAYILVSVPFYLHTIAPAIAIEPAKQSPTLQRVKILSTHSYSFDFAVPHRPATPALVLVEARNMLGTGADDRTVYHYLFHYGRANTKREPLRWDTNGGMIFCTYAHVLPGTGPLLIRYPIQALVSRPGPDMISALDRSKLDDRSIGPYGRPAPNYGGLGPIGAAYMGIDGWKVGDEPMQDGLHMSSNGAPIVHYDVRALDDIQVELYMTVSGKFSKWLFDGKKWTLSANYPRKVSGPFLICDEGNALVAEVDGHWCLVRGFDKQIAEVHQIAKKTDNEPLILVEDIVGEKSYFQYKGTLYDENRVTISAAPRGSSRLNQFKSIVDSVRSRRQK